MEKTKLNEQIQFNLALARISDEYDNTEPKLKSQVRNKYERPYQLNKYIPNITSKQKLISRYGELGLITGPLSIITGLGISYVTNGHLLLCLGLIIGGAVLFIISGPLASEKHHNKSWPNVYKKLQQIDKEAYIKYFIAEQQDVIKEIKLKQQLTKIPTDKQSTNDIYRIGKLEATIKDKQHRIKNDKKIIKLIWGENALTNYNILKNFKKNEV